MNKTRKIAWFKEHIEPHLNGYEVKYKHFPDGDFGSLDQIEFNSSKIGGNIDLWGTDRLGIFLWSYDKDEEIMNVLYDPEELIEKEQAIQKLTSSLLNDQ